MTTTNNQRRAIENEERILLAVGHVGWLSAAQIAAWCWPAGDSHSARVCADNALKRLTQKGLLKKRKSGRGFQVYVLTRTGALSANECARKQHGLRCDITLFRDGYSLSQLDDGRQSLAVAYLTAQHNAGNTVFGAASIRKAVENEFFEANLNGADGFVLDKNTDEAHAVLVIRNAHPELLKKAQRLRSVTGVVQLLGNKTAVRNIEKQLSLH